VERDILHAGTGAADVIRSTWLARRAPPCSTGNDRARARTLRRTSAGAHDRRHDP